MGGARGILGTKAGEGGVDAPDAVSELSAGELVGEGVPYFDRVETDGGCGGWF